MHSSRVSEKLIFFKDDLQFGQARCWGIFNMNQVLADGEWSDELINSSLKIVQEIAAVRMALPNLVYGLYGNL